MYLGNCLEVLIIAELFALLEVYICHVCKTKRIC